ncbi:MAG: hypothetical protein Q8868_01265 [Bacteroidota bacterium]|nr:hypothetical protein [Bacteroidota bacterium]
MKPDRSNYEIWSLDWLGGRLSEKQSEEFMEFLKENPDIRDEIDGLKQISLKPGINAFPGKESLRKTAESLTHEQFENLCIAYLEDDLSPDQKSELLEMTASDGSKKRELELTMKLRLKSIPYIYAGKKALKKLTSGQKVIRISITGLSIAATVAAIIGIYLLFPSGLSRKNNQAIVAKPDTLTILYPSKITTDKAQRAAISIHNTKNAREAAVSPEINNVQSQSAPDNQSKADSVIYIPEIQRAAAISVVNVRLPENILISNNSIPESILAFSREATLPSPFEEDRSNVERFFARIFHEKIMNDKAHATAPVTTFDIAVAGLTGLNKLFGWELALHKNIDERGEVRSYRFSSRLVNFNTPSRKDSGSL